MTRTSLDREQAERILAISKRGKKPKKERARTGGTARPRRSNTGESSANPNLGEATTSADVPENTTLAGSLLRQTGTDPETLFDSERHNKEDAYEDIHSESTPHESGTSDGSDDESEGDDEEFRVEEADENPQRSVVDPRQQAEDELERQALPMYGEDDSDYTYNGEVTDDEDGGFAEAKRQRNSKGDEGTSSGEQKRAKVKGLRISEACEHVLLRCKKPYDKQGLHASVLAQFIQPFFPEKKNILEQSVHSALKRDGAFERIKTRYRLRRTDDIERRMLELRERGEDNYPPQSQEAPKHGGIRLHTTAN